MWHVWGTGELRAVFWCGNLRENLGLRGRIILIWFIKKGNGDLDWIDVVRGRDRWLALGSAVMNLRGP